MRNRFRFASLTALFLVAALWAVLQAQDTPPPNRPEPPNRPNADRAVPATRPFDAVMRQFGPGGPRGPGGPDGPMAQERQLVKQFDKDGDGLLNKAERQAARDFLKNERGTRPGGRGFGPPRGFGRGSDREPGKPGPRISPADVKSFPDVPLYEPTVLRTLFLEFEDADWEAQLADFYHTDVQVPATLTVDGKKYPKIGVRFRGNTAFRSAGEGSKRPLKLSIDFVHAKQQLYGYQTLNLLNSSEDPTFLHSVLYLQMARQYTPAPKANFVRTVINGESWGVYINSQQFDKQFLKEWFQSSKGDRWRVPVAFRGGGGLSYLGEKVEDYKRYYEMKTNGGDKAWNALIALCRTLSQTPPDRLEEALKPILDVDHALWFLALENVLINNDGYWARASDYSLFRDKNGQFHVIARDVNETFKPAGGGPGMGPGPGRGPGGGFARGPRGGGVELDPLAGMNDPNKALLNRLLAVPALKARYLEHVRTIAQEWLDWNKLAPVVQQYQSLIEKEVEADTRKLYSYAAFKSNLGQAGPQTQPADRRGELSLRAFAEQRRNYLLNHSAIKQPAP